MQVRMLCVYNVQGVQCTTALCVRCSDRICITNEKQEHHKQYKSHYSTTILIDINPVSNVPSNCCQNLPPALPALFCLLQFPHFSSSHPQFSYSVTPHRISFIFLTLLSLSHHFLSHTIFSLTPFSPHIISFFSSHLIVQTL